MAVRIPLLMALVAVPALAFGQDAQGPSSESASLPEPTSAIKVLSDADLELAVRAAYSGAAAFASAHGNYFARNGAFQLLRDAVAAEVAKGFETVSVATTPAADLDAARVCLTAPGAELRIAVNTYGDGVSLAAVTDTRVFAYDYDPHKSPDISVIAASDCTKLR